MLDYTSQTIKNVVARNTVEWREWRLIGEMGSGTKQVPGLKTH